MKINWGTGIVLAFIAFISFILYFVIAMSTNKKIESDLVTENYYSKELQFESDLHKQRNAQSLKEDLEWKHTEEGLLIVFPQGMDPQKITGKMFLYRPSNKQLDFEESFSLSDLNLLIPKARLLDGRWNITVDWQYEGEAYLFKKEIVF